MHLDEGAEAALRRAVAARNLVVRKATLTSVLAKARVGIRYNEHLEFDEGEAVFPPTTP